MNADKERPTRAEMLAGLVTGNAEFEQMGASVQRSHRFPIWIFVQIENMARMADASVSVIVNQLLECGLEAVKKELPEDVASRLTIGTKEQYGRPTKSLREEVKRRKPSTESRSKEKK